MIITIGNIVIGDWVCESESHEQWRRYIEGEYPGYLEVSMIGSVWWILFYDHRGLNKIHTTMYRSNPENYNFREFSSREDAMNHTDDFLLKLSKLKAFL